MESRIVPQKYETKSSKESNFKDFNKSDGELNVTVKNNIHPSKSFSTTKKVLHSYNNSLLPPINMESILKKMEEDDDEEFKKISRRPLNLSGCIERSKVNKSLTWDVLNEESEEIKENIVSTQSQDCKELIQNSERPLNLPNHILQTQVNKSSTCNVFNKEEIKANVKSSNSQVITNDNAFGQNGKTSANETKLTKLGDSFDMYFTELNTPVKNQSNGQSHTVTPNNYNKPNIQYSSKKALVPSNHQTSLSTVDEIPKEVKKIFSNDVKDPNIITVNNKEYRILNILGRGGSSVVYHCSCPKSKKHYAIKCVSLNDPLSANGYINEVQILQTLRNCKKIIKMLDYQLLKNENKLLVVLEKGGDDLSSILKDYSSQMSHVSVYMLLFYWMEMLYAVREIHSYGIIHSDLKPANFIQVERSIKLIDFGIARCMQFDSTSVIKSNPEGSCNYISPEAIKAEHSSNINSPNYGKNKYKVNYKSDVWSLGCILYQLVYQITPFHHINQLYQKMFYIADPNHQINYPDAPWVPKKIIDTIKKCLQYDKTNRPSVDELIKEYEQSLLNLR